MLYARLLGASTRAGEDDFCVYALVYLKRRWTGPSRRRIARVTSFGRLPARGRRLLTSTVHRPAIALALVIAACTSASAPTSSGHENVTVTDKTASELVAVLGAGQTAMGKKDLAGFQATIDLSRAAFRRCQTETFDIAAQQGFTPFDVKIAKVERYLDTYVRAYVGNDAKGYSRTYFRKEGGLWIRTEPLDSELGGDQTKTFDGLQLSYYGIDSDVIDKYAAAGKDARAFLIKLAEGRTTMGPGFGLRIFPTRGAAGPNVSCSEAGTSLTNSTNGPFVRLYSNALLFTPDLTAVTDATAAVIRHDGLHWLQDHFIIGITARLPFWLREGWPDFVGGSRTFAAKKGVLCFASTPTPTFKQLEDGALETSQTPPNLAVQYYAFANTMVEYVYKIGGGANAYWDLMRAYQGGVDARVNLTKTLGVTPEAFYSGWLVWARQTYC